MWARKLWVAALIGLPGLANAQANEATQTTGALHGVLAPEDARRQPHAAAFKTVQDGIYQRPFVASASGRRGQTALGGYMEANSNYFVEEGVREDFSMEFRRFNLFTFTSIADRIQFFSELEFEDGAEEINLETAQIDFLVDRRLGLRAGIILPPIGRFNLNHDAPLYEFVERPLVSTELIPSTLSEVGVGAFGKFDLGREVTLTYDVYIVNGLQDGVLLNEQGRTSIPAGKDERAFSEDNNGRPSYTARLALVHPRAGEFGVSHYGGVFNDFRQDGERVAPKRRLHITAVDWQTDIERLTIEGEFAWASIDVPDQLRPLFGQDQYGLYVDLVYPIWTFDWLRDGPSVLNAAARIDRVDFNVGSFRRGEAAGDKIFDETTILTVGLALRPVPDTTIRINFRNRWHRDLLGNAAEKRRGFQVGVASYF